MASRGERPLRGTRFAAADIEAAFRSDRLAEDRRTGVVVFSVLALDMVLFALTDRNLPGGAEAARWLLALRVATAVALLLGMWLAQRAPRPLAVDGIHLVLSTLFAVAVLVIDSTRPRTNVIHLVPEVGLIYAGWIFFAGGYLFQAVTSLVFTSTSILSVVFFRDPEPPQWWVTLLLSVASIHVIGAFTSRRLQRSRRLEWLRARELERVSVAKSVFLGTVSHEILAPLGGIVMAADALRRRIPSDADRSAVEAIRNDGDALHALLSDVLDLARGEAVEPRISPASVSPRALLEDVVRASEARARAKGLELRCVVGPETPAWATLDPSRVRQVLVNLVGNAIRYTDRGVVSLRCEPEAGPRGTALLFRVDDSGPGIPREQQEAVFEPFWQAGAPGQEGRGGAGLGLAVARRLAERMGGRVDLESSPGKGSSFTLRLPEEPPPSGEPVPSSAPPPAPPPAAGSRDPALVEEALALAEVPHAGQAHALAERAEAAAAELGDGGLRQWAAEVRERADALDAAGLAAVLRRLPR
jgi:signal transduction histidine kinase